LKLGDATDAPIEKDEFYTILAIEEKNDNQS
jgi:hypothetical protein